VDGTDCEQDYFALGRAALRATGVSRPFPSWNRSTLTEIYLCHACSYHENEDGNEPRGCRLPPTDDSLFFGCDFPTQRAGPVTKLSGLTHHRAQAKQVVSLGGGGIAAREAQHGTRDDRTAWTVYAVGRGDKERFASLCDFVANRTVQDGLITLVRGKDPAEEDAFSGIIDHVGAAAAATKDNTGGNGNDATL
jgi:hypothetical protein